MTPPRLLIPILLVLSTAAFADFHLEVTQNRAAEGAVIRLTVVNATLSEAQNVYVGYPSTEPAVTQVASPDWNCTAPSASVICTLTPALAAGQSATLELRVNFGQTPYARKELGFVARATIEGTVQGSFVIGGAAQYRHFIVTQTGDSGPGSLRAAIEAVNADATCATLPCAIDFDIVSPDAVHQIALRSPLPQINAWDVLVDGTTQPSGQIEIDGAGPDSGNGLDFNGALRAEAIGLTLRKFGNNAILIRNRVRQKMFDTTPALFVSHCIIQENFRGIVLSPGWFDGGAIRDCVISHNIRSGIFDWSEHDPGFPLLPVLRVERNTISDNGASGIFLGEGSDGALLAGNVIERNRDFGVAVARGAINVRILANSIAHNGNSAIDVGLDGPSSVAPSRFGNRVMPVIASAVYDPATNTTTVRGTPAVTPISTCDLCQTNIVSLYANDAAEHGQYAEAQTYLGDAQPNGNGFVFTYKGDLRGKYLTALDTLWANLVGSNLYVAGELSKAFLVR